MKPKRKLNENNYKLSKQKLKINFVLYNKRKCNKKYETCKNKNKKKAEKNQI